MASPRKSHQSFLTLLQTKETNGKPVTKKEILKATGWRPVTLQTYLAKGQLSEYLNEVDNDAFAVSNTISLDPITFSRNLSQSKHRRELGFHCKYGLSKALLKRSRDNMILALELYNRPSLENRLDSFVLCFCTAWEQLLKSILIEKDSEKTIFQKNVRHDGIRETISLRECLNRHFEPQSLVRKNIELITYYRDQAVHLLMPEVQGNISRVFQSGVMNYGNAFHTFSQQPFLPSSHSGMLSLVGDLRSPSNATIIARYGDNVGKEIISLLKALEAETKEIADIEFAIPLNVKLVFATCDEEGNTIKLSKAEEGMKGLADAFVVEKPVDREKTHPYRTNTAINEINHRLSNKFDDEIIIEHLRRSPASKTPPTEINNYDFRAVAHKLNWKKSNNAEHYLHKNPETHYYSDSALEIFISKVFDNNMYLENARKRYSNSIK